MDSEILVIISVQLMIVALGVAYKLYQTTKEAIVVS